MTPLLLFKKFVKLSPVFTRHFIFPVNWLQSFSLFFINGDLNIEPTFFKNPEVSNEYSVIYFKSDKLFWSLIFIVSTLGIEYLYNSAAFVSSQSVKDKNSIATSLFWFPTFKLNFKIFSCFSFSLIIYIFCKIYKYVNYIYK